MQKKEATPLHCRRGAESSAVAHALYIELNPVKISEYSRDSR